MIQASLISVLMPVRNAADFVAETIVSILEQSYSNWELIIVNDFSTDESPVILNEFALQDDRISVFQNEKKGIIPALQLAFNNSKGEFITRMDADDIMPPSKLELFYKQIKKSPDSIITGKVKYFAEELVSEGYVRYENWLNDLVEQRNHWDYVYRECIIASPNWMVSRSCFQTKFSFEDLVYPEDYDMVFKWYEHGYLIQVVPEITHLWREHPNRTSRNVADYQQTALFHLKTNRFLDYEIKEGEPVQLIGAGGKGKLVANEMIQRGIDFTWFDLNAKNHNTLIKGKSVLSIDLLQGNVKSILTVWPTGISKQKEISAFLKGKGLILGENTWLF